MAYEFQVVSVPGGGKDADLKRNLDAWGEEGYAVVAGLHVVDNELRNLLILQRPKP